MAKRFNIRMAGVGGQGVVTGSHILSTAVINAGGGEYHRSLLRI